MRSRKEKLNLVEVSESIEDVVCFPFTFLGPRRGGQCCEEYCFLESLDFKSWGAGDEAVIQEDEHPPPRLVNWWVTVHKLIN